MTLRSRTNLARKLQPVMCLNRPEKSAWAMKSVSGDRIQVAVKKATQITSFKTGKVRHAVYFADVMRINQYNEAKKYYGPHALEYALASIMAEASKAKKRIVFYSSLKSVELKKRIQDVSMIEVKAGKETVWGIFYNEN